MGVARRRFRQRDEFRVVDALNDEWERLAQCHQQTVRRWAAAKPALAGCGDLRQVLQAASRNADAVLAALLAEDAEHPQLAARVVLQVMLGRAVAMSVRDPDADVDDYVAALWCRIRTYPLRDRPLRIAANLALDVLKMVKSERQWTRRAVTVATLPWGPQLDEVLRDAQDRLLLDHNAASEVTARAVLRAANQLGLIDAATRAVLTSVYFDGLSSRDAASRHRTSPDMVRFRCSKAVRRLALHAEQLVDAA